MSSATADVIKLGPVLDLAAAEGFLATMRERVRSATATCLDAAAVEVLALPCIQIILAAAKSGHKIKVENPSEAFAAAFADVALDWPRDSVGAAPAAAEPAVIPIVASPPVAAPVFAPELDPVVAAPDAPVASSQEANMPRRILTIDDSKTIRDMLRMTLAGAGYEVLQAADGQEGIDIMDREKVDLVITDINMPRMNGYEVVRHLRGKPVHKHLPILVLTTESDADKKHLAREAGATGWMVKPFDPDRLLATVNKVIPQG
jgi:two-component system chemotaxis response regulator CheY